MTSRDDELLTELPRADHHLGRLAGYREGSRVRRVVFGLLVVSVPVAVLAGRCYAQRLARQLRPVAPSYELGEGVDGSNRPGELVWTNGVARLGLSRIPPGVERIVLPDRTLRLATGHDHAQVKVEVRDGKTVAVVVLVGAIAQDGPTRAEQSVPAGSATAR